MQARLQAILIHLGLHLTFKRRPRCGVSCGEAYVRSLECGERGERSWIAMPVPRRGGPPVVVEVAWKTT